MDGSAMFTLVLKIYGDTVLYNQSLTQAIPFILVLTLTVNGETLYINGGTGQRESFTSANPDISLHLSSSNIGGNSNAINETFKGGISSVLI